MNEAHDRTTRNGNERTNAQKRNRTNERTNHNKNERTRNNIAIERTNEKTNERKNEQTNERKNNTKSNNSIRNEKRFTTSFLIFQPLPPKLQDFQGWMAVARETFFIGFLNFNWIGIYFQYLHRYHSPAWTHHPTCKGVLIPRWRRDDAWLTPEVFWWHCIDRFLILWFSHCGKEKGKLFIKKDEEDTKIYRRRRGDVYY